MHPSLSLSTSQRRQTGPTLLLVAALAASVLSTTLASVIPASIADRESSLSLSSSSPAYDVEHIKAHAPQIFNSIADAGKQFGSAIHHNGMSFFFATTPEGVEFYHGTGQAEPVNGTEWVAFEPEHASNFAAMGRGPGRGGGRPGHGGGPPPPSALRNPQQATFQAPDVEIAKEGEVQLKGYLHTYVTKRRLNLIYVDGEGAAKTKIGTLDTQDVVLRGEDPESDSDSLVAAQSFESESDVGANRAGPMEEYERASELCALSRDEWDGAIDGFVRMEMGFEIIVCDFSDAFHFSEAKQILGRSGPPGGGPGGPGGPGGGGPGKGPGGHPPPAHSDDAPATDGVLEPSRAVNFPADPESFFKYKAISARFEGLGAQRLHIDCDTFLSLWSIPGAIYPDASRGLPRVNTTMKSELKATVGDLVREGVAKSSSAVKSDIDWQGVTEMYALRYSDALLSLTSTSLQSILLNSSSSSASIQEATTYLNGTLRALWLPFVDWSRRDGPVEVDRCVRQYLPYAYRGEAAGEGVNPLLYHTFHSTLGSLCSTLHEAFFNLVASSKQDSSSSSSMTVEASKSKGAARSLSLLISLRETLDWSSFRRCHCQVDEVCLVPMWPMGSWDEWENPRCSKTSQGGRGYWND